MGTVTNILITVNDNENFKNILGALNSQNGLNIIGVENDETNTIIKSERLKPDVLILDLMRPAIDEAELAPIIHRRSPDTAIIMICDKDENEYAEKAIRAGILGYLIRNADMNKILPVIKIVSLGGYYISASIIKRASDSITVINQFPNRFIDNQDNKKENCLFLSPVERCIVSEIAQGLSDEEIAVHLNYSAGTIRNCVTAIKRKTKLKNRVEIVVFSLVYGLIDVDQLDFWGQKRVMDIF
jgi:DNA-binding NarL/FixJ family response regulator